MDKEKMYLKYIPVRIGVSVFIAFILYIICGMAYEDFYYYGISYSPQDYLSPALNEFHITVIICTGIFLILTLFIWTLSKLKWRFIAAGSIVVLLIGTSLLATYQESLFEIHAEGRWIEEVKLTAYEPFREDTRAKNLDEESSLHLQDYLPRLDGATALYPLYAAFARATYPMAEYRVYDENSIIVCSRTSGAFGSLLDGTADLIFLMGISEDQREQAEEHGLELILTPIGKEAFVFFVNTRNPMSNLSVENIIGIYSGQITNWREVGGSYRRILAYQRPETSGSQIMLREIMGDVPIIEAPGVDIYDEMMGMYMAVAYKNHRNALGYSFRFYINDMIAENRIKFLAIDGVEPTVENIASGAYPFTHEFYAVSVVRQGMTDDEKARAENTQKLIEWILSPQGQSLVEKTGYVAIGGGGMSIIDDNIDRILTASDFAFLEKGMSLEEIISVVGEIDGISGYNNLTPFYILNDGRLGLVFEPLFLSSFEYLLYYTISCPDGEHKRVDFE